LVELGQSASWRAFEAGVGTDEVVAVSAVWVRDLARSTRTLGCARVCPYVPLSLGWEVAGAASKANAHGSDVVRYWLAGPLRRSPYR
jgi:hypothetical protein